MPMITIGRCRQLNSQVVKASLVLTILLAMPFLLSGSNVHAANGDFLWAKSMGGTGFDEGYDIAVDSSGNVHTTGFFQGTVDFDPGPGIFNLVSSGGFDVFVSKLDSNGNFLWAKSMGGTGLDQGLGIAVDGSGNVHTTGLFQGTVDFDPGPDIFNLTSNGGRDSFVSNLDSNGNFLWAKSMGATGLDEGLGIALDGSGNVHTTGNFSGTADFDPGPDIFNLVSNGDRDSFVSNLDSNGNFLWAKSMGATVFDEGLGIALDGSGNVHTTGLFQGTVDFDPGPDTFNLTSSGSEDVFVSKLDSNGDFVWAKSMGGPGGDGGIDIAMDGSGNVHTTGYFSGTSDFDPGPGIFNLTSNGGRDSFVSKLDSNGNFLWAKSMGGAGFDEGLGIAVDSSGNVHTTGLFQGTVDFDPGPDTFDLTSIGSHDVFISKHDSNGDFVWAKSMGGPGSDVSRNIAVDGSGNVHIVGRFDGTADFDPGPGTFDLASNGGFDIFISKLSHLQPPQLTVIKTVVTDDGGTAAAGDWTMDITGINVSSTGFPGAESPGVTITLDAGPYSIDESGGPSGYVKSLSADCAGTITVGESKTCTITNDDVARVGGSTSFLASSGSSSRSIVLFAGGVAAVVAIAIGGGWYSQRRCRPKR